MGILTFTNSVGLQTSTIHSYRAISGEALARVILVRNTMSFAVGYGVTPWVERIGLRAAFGLATAVGVVQVAKFFFVVVVRWGKGWRGRSRERYWGFGREGDLSE